MEDALPYPKTLIHPENGPETVWHPAQERLARQLGWVDMIDPLPEETIEERTPAVRPWKGLK